MSIVDLQLQVLKEISKIIDKALNIEDSIDEILKILSKSLSMQRATITLYDENTGNLTISASYGLSQRERQRGTYALGEGVTGKIFQTGQPYFVPDIRKEPLFLNKTKARDIKKERISFIGVPIMLNGKTIGVFHADRLFDDGISFEKDLEFLQVVATFVGQFISINRKILKREERLKRENINLRKQIKKETGNLFMVGKSAAMEEVQRMLEKVAPTKASVLLLGESGVGKTLIAKIIHIFSDRKKGPFIKVNCAAIPETLIESELFGVEKGAFTGASATRPGKFEEAENGTIFLDEVGELPVSVQAKLLRILQERELERLGSSKTRKIDVRILTATNQNLEQLVQTGEFRADLYYRLNVFPIIVPALRHRKEDIPGLLNHFAAKIEKDYGRRIFFSKQALDYATQYDWPGNVREMENLMERLAIVSDNNQIEMDLLKKYISTRKKSPSPKPPLKIIETETLENLNLQDLEKERIVEAMKRNGWIQYKAAKELGLTPRQIGYRIQKFCLEPIIAQGKVEERNGE